MAEVAQVGDVVAALGECPVWSGQEQVLYWEDIEGRAIHRYDPATETTESRSLVGRPGSFVLTNTAGRLLVATETDLVWLDWATGTTTPFASVEDAASGNRLNDGRCDSAGRFVVGTMHPEPEEGHFNGSLYSIDHSGVVTTLENEVGVPNGLVFDEDRSRMYWTDTLRKVIWMWDYELATGERRNKRVFFDYDAHDQVRGLPDGACLDIDGCYWSASVYGWCMTRITPDGTVDRIVEVPVQKPSMPAFGGTGLSTMYITTIGNTGLTPSQPGKYGFEPGVLLAVDVGVGGIAEPAFAAPGPAPATR